MRDSALDIAIDHSARPIYRQILEQLQALVTGGTLAAGARLPNQRELAQRLNVNIATVNRAYREAVRRRLLVSTPRRGTHVAPQAGFLVGWNGLQGERADLIDMENNAAPIDLPMRSMSEVFTEISRQDDLRHIYGYSSIYGRSEHRKAMASWLTRHGVSADANHLVLTSGANHAIYLVLAVLSRPNDVIVADELSFPCLDELSRVLNLRLLPLRRIAGRVDLDETARLFSEARPRFLFVMPEFASPTTEYLDETERQELTRLCRKADCFVIEDSVHMGLVERKGRPLQSYLPQSTFLVTSFSKIVAPGFCLGTVLCPDREYTDRIARRLGITNRMASPIMGEIAARMIESNEMSRVLGFVRSEYRIRNRIAAETLEGCRVLADSYGTHFWVELPREANATQLVEALHRRGVSVLPDRVFATTAQRTRSGFRATLGALPRRHQVIRGCQIIREVLEAAD